MNRADEYYSLISFDTARCVIVESQSKLYMQATEVATL